MRVLVRDRIWRSVGVLFVAALGWREPVVLVLLVGMVEGTYYRMKCLYSLIITYAFIHMI